FSCAVQSADRSALIRRAVATDTIRADFSIAALARYIRASMAMNKTKVPPTMLIGFNLPISGPMATATDMARVAKLGEEIGFDHLTLTYHIALRDVASPGYPYSESGEFYSPDPGHRMEQLTAAAWIAAKTER